MDAIEDMTDVQFRRIAAVLAGNNCNTIAEREGVTRQAVRQSIVRGILAARKKKEKKSNVPVVKC